VTPELPWTSEIDDRLGVPGADRFQLALDCATHALDHALDATFDDGPWQSLRELDDAHGFGTRFAARALLRRPSDGRVVIFRYPFRDGTVRTVIPGGGADPGEGPLDAVRREVLEETGTEALDLRPSGVLLFHLLAPTVDAPGRTPTIQYSPVYTGSIDDELPHTDGREAHWVSAEEFAAMPRRPITAPIVDILRAVELGESLEPTAIWLPA
jgi:8-oxo-dGTP pyrophosphatase MutT (NUDIX family)